MLTRFSERAKEKKSSRKSRRRDSDVFWSTEPWTCSKQLKHYPAFSWRDTSIKVHSFVWVLNEDFGDRIGYLEDIFEDSDGKKMVKVRYFLSAKDIERHVQGLVHESRELFITPSIHEVRANSVDGVAAVLNQEHFVKCGDYLPPIVASKTFVSYREYKDGTIGPFALSSLTGYFDQPILGPVEHYERVSIEERRRELESRDTVGRSEGVSPSENPRNSSREVSNDGFFRPGDYVEVLRENSRIRGCWFRCKVLGPSSPDKWIEVEYCDLKSEGTGEKPKQVIPLISADRDPLGLRLDGRPTVRPLLHREPCEIELELGRPVDVRLRGGWWEGVVIGHDQSANHKLIIYLPGKKKYLDADTNDDISISKEWFKGRWVSLEAKPDVLSSISSL